MGVVLGVINIYTAQPLIPKANEFGIVNTPSAPIYP